MFKRLQPVFASHMSAKIRFTSAYASGLVLAKVGHPQRNEAGEGPACRAIGVLSLHAAGSREPGILFRR